jgi:galactokinase
MMQVTVPGRVNLIGDHTDYVGGLVLPMAVDRWVELRAEIVPGLMHLVSDADPDAVDLSWPQGDAVRLMSLRPDWARHVLAVARELETRNQTVVAGLRGSLASTIPVGAGLSSSAALDIALALALGFEGNGHDLAQLTRAAEHAATGVPVGIMDQLCIATATEGHLSLIDCQDLLVTPVRLPESAEVRVLFVAKRRLEGSAYATRVAECAAAEAEIGPLRSARIDDVDAFGDPVIASRALHVITENQRVLDMVTALSSDDLSAAGALMSESHWSLARKYQVSTPEMDQAVMDIAQLPGVFGVRMTGGGFGGCVVMLCAAGAGPDIGWLMRPVGAPTVIW